MREPCYTLLVKLRMTYEATIITRLQYVPMFMAPRRSIVPTTFMVVKWDMTGIEQGWDSQASHLGRARWRVAHSIEERLYLTKRPSVWSSRDNSVVPSPIWLRIRSRGSLAWLKLLVVGKQKDNFSVGRRDMPNVAVKNRV